MIPRRWLLLAEDNVYDAELALRTLSDDQIPCDVRVARDGQEALDCLSRRGDFQARMDGEPALVLLDLKMPKLDGLEVLRQLKTDERLRAIPVVIFTSSREEADLHLCYQLGANGYVVKPVDYAEFGAVLHAIKAFWMAANEPPPRAVRDQPAEAPRNAELTTAPTGPPSPARSASRRLRAPTCASQARMLSDEK